MDYTGLFMGYKCGQKLNREECELQLGQKKRIEIVPSYHLSIIRINSTFIESVDRYYAWRGVISAFMYAMMGAYASIALFGVLGIERKWSSFDENQRSSLRYAGAAFFFMGAPLFAALIWIALKESFTFTHFPIRLNRKNRKVYVFRPMCPWKPILVSSWEKIFFTMGRCNKGIEPGQSWDIRGHVLAEDGKTVLDTFAFSDYWNEHDLDGLRGHWEFLRRYMEDGPREAFETVKVCLPIADRRETLRYAYNRFYLNFKGGLWLWFMLLPLWLVCVLARWLSGLTCRVPKWPQGIEDECRIEPNDPYSKDASMNPANAWEW